MNFIIKSLHHTEFNHLFQLDDATLAQKGIVRMTADKHPGFPCRVSLKDAEVGEEVLLLPYPHHRANSPYQASGPIFVRRNAQAAQLAVNEIPGMLLHRLLSLRGYDAHGMMKEGVIVEGAGLKEQLTRIFENEAIQYIHIHNAKPGCYNCVVERA